MTIAEVHEFFLRRRSECLRLARDASGFTRVVVLKPSKQFLRFTLRAVGVLVSELLSGMTRTYPRASLNGLISRQ